MTQHAPVKRDTATIWLRALAYALASVALLVVLFVAYAQWVAVQRLQDIAQVNRANGALLVQCNTPPEERDPPVQAAPSSDCYLRNQAVAGQAVQDVRVISVAAAACGAANPGNVQATEECVNETLRARPATTPRRKTP